MKRLFAAHRVQHELLRIAQEAIRNSVRHANPTTISVSLHRDGNNLELQIRDNGHGIPPSQLLSQNGFGLINMQSRTKKVGTSLDIPSDAGAGTAHRRAATYQYIALQIKA